MDPEAGRRVPVPEGHRLFPTPSTSRHVVQTLRSLRLLAAAALIPAHGCSSGSAATQRVRHDATSLPTGATRSAETDDGQWLMPAHDYASTRFSALTEINTGNVSRLQAAWTFSTGVERGHEAAPLVVGSTMYVVTPYP